MNEIVVGSTHTSTMTVTESNTALALGSGDLQVLGTPAMTALMENAAMLAIAPFLDPAGSESSVGVSLNVAHLRVAEIGAQISATAVVTAVQGRQADFEIIASDSTNQTVGKGTHIRFVVDVAKFMSKIEK